MFREDKTTQMAAAILKRSGGRIKYIHLMKMLYFADKQMLVERGMPITYDAWVSMEHGPVLSSTLDLIRTKGKQPSYWSKHITTEGNDVVLQADPGDDDLSLAEDAIIEKVFGEWGHVDRWEVVRASHNLPEWNDPGQSVSPISYEEVLKVSGFTMEDTKGVLENIEMQDDLRLLRKAA